MGHDLTGGFMGREGFLLSGFQGSEGVLQGREEGFSESRIGARLISKKKRERRGFSGTVDFFLGNKQRTLTRILSRQLLLPPRIEH